MPISARCEYRDHEKCDTRYLLLHNLFRMTSFLKKEIYILQNSTNRNRDKQQFEFGEADDQFNVD